jgi:hypothetical protein
VLHPFPNGNDKKRKKQKQNAQQLFVFTPVVKLQGRWLLSVQKAETHHALLVVVLSFQL